MTAVSHEGGDAIDPSRPFPGSFSCRRASTHSDRRNFGIVELCRPGIRAHECERVRLKVSRADVMSQGDRSELISMAACLIGGFLVAVVCEWGQVDLWVEIGGILAGGFTGIALHALWERRPNGRNVRPERLKDIATAIQTFRAGTDNLDHHRRWVAINALQRIAAHEADQADRERIGAFARTELESEVREPSRHYSNAEDLIHLMAIAGLEGEERFLESLIGTPGGEVVRERLADMRRPPLLDADRQYVRDALVRFEGLGLRIRRHLDRELIVARALLEAGCWRYVCNHPPEIGKRLAPDPLAMLFVVLAGETNELHDYEMIGSYRADSEVVRSIRAEAEMSPNFADEYSSSIFENAAEIGTVNEGDALGYILQNIVALSGGIISVAPGSDPHSGTLKIISDGEIFTCLVDGCKRPDLTSLYEILNEASSKHGLRYVFPSPGANSDSEIIACISLSKLDAFNAFVRTL
jgi:hypothetical protein